MTLPRRPEVRFTLGATACILLALAAPVRAQLLGGLPQLPVGMPVDAIDRAAAARGEVHARIADPVVRRLVRRHPERVAVDPDGAAIVRHEIVAIDPRAEALALARAAGFEVIDQARLEGLGFSTVVLRAPRGLDTARALARLRAIDPQGSYAFNHLYFGSRAAAIDAGTAEAPLEPVAAATRVGLIDSGIAPEHPALRDVEVHAWGCNGDRVPGAHGTAVASLLGVSTLYSADIYCGQPTGGSATAFAAAMAWLAREQVPLVNISLAGPDNALVRRATAAMVARGHVLVAAVGNDGPAAAPLYPAGYDGVIGVTGVDARRRALPEALRGGQVDFAAPGSDLRAARLDGGWDEVRGTSFATPLVAHALALLLAQPARDAPSTARLRERLAADAIDLGDPGRDDTYGHGLVSRMNGS